VITRPRLTGICGSDSKQILLDFGEGDTDNAMAAFCSFPQVMGHEVVADVVALGPTARGLEIGQRVVLNPWLSCGPRGIEFRCPACETGDYSLCWSFTDGDIKPGIHTGVSADVTGGYAELMPARDSMLFAVPDSVPDEVAVFADPFSVSLHAITRHPPPPTGRVLVYGAGSLGLCAVAVLRALYPQVAVAVVARFDARRNWRAGSAQTSCSCTNPASPSSRNWSRGVEGGCGSRCRGCRWPIPARSMWSMTP
jgi:threonine dehydrogenase-like Zn-dependent dehydrogenase